MNYVIIHLKATKIYENRKLIERSGSPLKALWELLADYDSQMVK